MPSDRPPLSEFWTSLPREGRLLLSVVAFQFIGTGLVLPFWVVYLHEVRHFPLDTVGLLLGWLSMGALIGTVPGGVAIDHFGSRKVMIGATAATSIGQAIMAFATTIPLAVLGLGLVGISFGVTWPAAQSMISVVIPEPLRPRYFGLNFALLNLGIGVGGIIGGLVADIARPLTFTVMYLVESLSYWPALFLLLVPLRHIGAPVARPTDSSPRVGYLDVLRRPEVGALATVNFLAAFVGYGQINSGATAYARLIGQVSTRGLGFAFAVNTLAIVLLQLVVLQRIEGHRRTRLIVLMCVLWLAAWLLLASSSLVPGTLAATMLVAAFMGVFALGETLLQPTIPAIVNAMSPDHLRGRYNGVTSAAFQLACVVGPIAAGALMDAHRSGLYIASLVVGCILLAGGSVFYLEPRLSAEGNGLGGEGARSAEPITTH